MLVIAGEASHQLLRIIALHVEKEPGRRGATENTGWPPVMQQFDVAVLA